MEDREYELLQIAIIKQGFDDLAYIHKTIKRNKRKPKFPCHCIGFTANSMNELYGLYRKTKEELRTPFCRSLIDADMDKLIEKFEREKLK